MEASTIQTTRHPVELVRAAHARTARRNGGTVASRPVAGQVSQSSEIARRLVNVAAATLMLIPALPLMIVIGVLVKLTSRGPILFVQQRVGLDRRNGPRATAGCKRLFDRGGRPFRMYKFRTMYVNDRPGEQVWAKPDDPRVTPVGRVLRKYRLDELPQILNVLRGDMNLVGPRPEQPKIFARLREHVDRYGERQQVRPGITGWAQINLRYDSSMDDVVAKLALDLQYIQRRSALQDLKIMFRTVPVVLFRRGAW